MESRFKFIYVESTKEVVVSTSIKSLPRVVEHMEDFLAACGFKGINLEYNFEKENKSE